MEAATSTSLSQGHVSDRLYVPEPFRLEVADAIEGRRRSQWTLIEKASETSLMLVIGEIKRIAPCGSSFTCTIKHLPFLSFALTKHTYQTLGRLFAREIALWHAAPGGHLMAMATVRFSDADRPRLGHLGLQAVTSEWLPVNDAVQLAFVQRLVSEGKAFVTDESVAPRTTIRRARGLSTGSDLP